MANKKTTIRSAGPAGPASSAVKTALKVGGVPVNEFRLIRFGFVEADDAARGGSFLFTRVMAAQAVKHFNTAGHKLKIDYEHQSFAEFNTREDGLAPAAGWIGGLEIRPDGLWAVSVEFTPEAHAMIAAGKYRYFSPTIQWADPPRKTALHKLCPVGLTNEPAMRDVPELAAAQAAVGVTCLSARKIALRKSRGTRGIRNPQSAIVNCTAGTEPGRSAFQQDRPGDSGPGMNKGGSMFQQDRPGDSGPGMNKGGSIVEQLLELLGLAAGATLEEVLAAITEENMVSVAEVLGLPAEATREEVEAAIRALFAPPEEEDVPAAETVAKVAAGLGLKGVSNVTALVAAVKKQAGTAAAGERRTSLSLARRLTVVETSNAELLEQRQRGEFTALAQNKIAPAGQEGWFGLYQKDPEAVKTTLEALPELVGSKSVFAASGNTAAADGPPDKKALKAEWDRNQANAAGVTLQAEFGEYEVFAAYAKHARAGHVTILGAKQNAL